ncbi:MAG TPA: hypothetical protein VEF76_05965 [Patescibacteria group bacterium]|nr:hypothetical protein [Patescibacteria group bacterium]
MHLKFVSITGADDAINPQDLVELSREFPFAEWAVLLLPARAGTPRFPKYEWIRSLAALGRELNTAMHLCDEALLGFIRGDNDIQGLMSGYKRIQLNLKFGAVEGKYDPADLIARVRANSQFQFIIQYGRDKQSLLPLLADIPNHAVLYDDSAGRGITPESWDAPLPGHFCGYAGGLNPDNVAQQLKTIAQVAKDYVTWIDMETGVRTNDAFDLAKVRRVLEISQPYTIAEDRPAAASKGYAG